MMATDTARLYTTVVSKIARDIKLPKALKAELDAAQKRLADVNFTSVEASAEQLESALAERVLAGEQPKDSDYLALAVAPVRARVAGLARQRAQEALADTYYAAREPLLQLVRDQQFEPALDRVRELAATDWAGETSGKLFELGKDELAQRVRDTENAAAQIASAYRSRDGLYNRHGAMYGTDFGKLGCWPLIEGKNYPALDSYGMPYDGWTNSLDSDAHYRLHKLVEAIREGAEPWLPSLDEALDAEAGARDVATRRALDALPADQRRKFERVYAS